MRRKFIEKDNELENLEKGLEGRGNIRIELKKKEDKLNRKGFLRRNLEGFKEVEVEKEIEKEWNLRSDVMKIEVCKIRFEKKIGNIIK